MVFASNQDYWGLPMLAPFCACGPGLGMDAVKWGAEVWITGVKIYSSSLFWSLFLIYFFFLL